MAVKGYRLALADAALADNEALIRRWLSAGLVATAPTGSRRSVWLAGRILLAMLLEREALPPLRIGPNGKPFHPQLPHFNISNSGSGVAVLLGEQEVGCDIERLRSRPRFMAVARHSFSPLLVDRLASLPPDQQPAAFWRLWTAHEAVLKQRGGTVWQMPSLTLPPGTLCPPGRYLIHLTQGNTLIACCGCAPFPAYFQPEMVLP